MRVTKKEVCASLSITGPYRFEDIKDRPGVYRFQEVDSPPGALVIMHDGKRVYIDGEARVIQTLDPTDISVEITCADFWTTNMGVPDQIED